MSDKSFLNVLVIVISGAAFATGAILMNSMQRREPRSGAVSMLAQQEAPALYSARLA
jgi:hypothetical protein